jgi:hypothetical protein
MTDRSRRPVFAIVNEFGQVLTQRGVWGTVEFGVAFQPQATISILRVLFILGSSAFAVQVGNE